MKDNIFIHESSYVDGGASIGNGTKIWHFSHIMSKAIIGKNCNFGQNVFIGDDVIIGDNVKVQNNVSIYRGVIIEDNVFIGPSVVFTNVINPRSFIDRNKKYKETVVSKGATIGANSTIICGNIIYDYAFVGAGSVVTKNVIEHSVVWGNPARDKGIVCGCGSKMFLYSENKLEERLSNFTKCEKCGFDRFKFC